MNKPVKSSCNNCIWGCSALCLAPNGCRPLTYEGMDGLASKGTWIKSCDACPPTTNRISWENPTKDEPCFNESDIVLAKSNSSYHRPICYAYYRRYDDGTDGWNEVCGDVFIEVSEWMPMP